MADLRYYGDEEIGGAAASALADALSELIDAGESPRLAIPGGSALAVLREAREALGDKWRKVRLTWVDERCVDMDHADSNRGEAYRAGALDERCPPAAELPLWEDGDDADSACERVGPRLEEEFGSALDVCLLGMGPDGHIASLFPGNEHFDPQDDRSVLHVPNSPKPPAERMSLSLRVLQTARRHILVAKGEGKREALGRLLAGDSALPPSHLNHLTILTNLVMDTNEETNK